MSSRGLAIGAVLLIIVAGGVWWAVGGDDGNGGQAEKGTTSAADTTADSPTGTRIEGYVIDRGTGVSLTQATVTVACGDDSEPMEVGTDETGGFIVDDLPPDGECKLSAASEGYVAASGGDGQSSATVTLRDGIDVHGIELSLYEASRISGKVAVDGKGLADCVFTVLYLEAPGRDEPYTVDADAVSAADGTFSIPGLAPGRVQVLAEHADHAMAESGSFFLKAGQHRKGITINLAVGGAISGTVVDGAGQPMEGARVALYTKNAGPRDRALRRARSDADGRFAFEGVSVGAFRVTATAMGYRSGTAPLEVVAGETATASLTLTRRDGMGGVVVDDQGQPVSGAAIYSSDPEARGRMAARSNGTGRFWVGWRPKVGTTLFAQHASYASSAPVKVGEGHPDVTLTLKPGGRLRARVLDPDGRPVAVYSASIWPEPGTRARGKTVRSNDSSGILEVASVAPGTYTIRVTAAGYPPAVTKPFKVAAKQLTDAGDIRLAGGGQVTGRVVDAATNKPLRGVRVYLSAARAAGYRGRAPTASTGADGEFVIRGLPPGRLSLRFMRQGFLTRVESAIEVTAKDPMDIGDISLSRATGDSAGRGRMQYQGVGAVLRRQGDGLLVQRVFDGAPAAEAGLVAGTSIQTINGTPVSDLDLRRAVELIRGESGSEVTLQVVLPGGSSPETIRVVRGEVVTPKQQRRRQPQRRNR